MEAHESRCFRNPSRTCELCAEIREHDMPEINASFACGDLVKLREAAMNCPACIMAAIIQFTDGKDLNEVWVQFDYKKEKADWDAEAHRLAWEGVAF